FFLFIFLLTVVGGRAYQLQILKQPELFRLAERQREHEVELKSYRGVICDRNHNELAVSVEVDSVYAHPRQIIEQRKTAAILSDILEGDARNLFKKLKNSSNFVWIDRGISPVKRTQVENLKLPGIYFIKENKRFYPHCNIGGHLLGFVGIDGQGLEGLEYKYEFCLAGGSKYLLAERDALGHEFFSSSTLPLELHRGHNLVLTVDLTIQYILEKELKRAVQQSHARGGMGVIMNPKTGEILALALQPDFNPNNFRSLSADIWRNRIVTDCFDPGSTFKIFLGAAALEERVVSPEEVIYCENGLYRIGKKTIHDTHKYENLSFSEVIKYSSNIGAVKVCERLKPALLYEYIRRFGFGEKTGVDFPAESSGLVRPYQNWKDIDRGSISFGQGISVTAVQLINGLCAIANGGYLMRPYIVKEVVNEKGESIKRNHPKVIRNVVSEKTCKMITDMMVMVVEDGTGKNARINGFEVAGKTGTAQKIDTATGSFSQSKFIGSFMGFVPARNPRLAVLIVIDEPQGRGFGGTVAAPAFKNVSEQTLSYLNVFPQPESLFRVVSRNNSFSTDGFEKHTQDSPDKNYCLKAIPNFTGLSMRRVLQLATEYPLLTVHLEGTGRATSQKPSPGSPLLRDAECLVTFKPVT
ncbi:MAG: transpeptidase family protein, partial [Proteobacteria bacterium]|nr:transpeptidase family protein [Pseudomonadota bacterium]